MSEFQYETYKTSKDRFHKKLRELIDLFWPGTEFDEQMRHTWITDSVLCSARSEGASVQSGVAGACRSKYLEKQLKLFPNAMIVALGGKAQRRLEGWPDVVCAYSVAPPGCNYKTARRSWDDAAKQFRAFLGKAGAGT